jgi:hypothetical protein
VLIHPTYRRTQSTWTGLRKQSYSQQETNVNCFSKAVRYSFDTVPQSYNSNANGCTYLITTASSVAFSHISWCYVILYHLISLHSQWTQIMNISKHELTTRKSATEQYSPTLPVTFVPPSDPHRSNSHYSWGSVLVTDHHRSYISWRRAIYLYTWSLAIYHNFRGNGGREGLTVLPPLVFTIPLTSLGGLATLASNPTSIK